MSVNKREFKSLGELKSILYKFMALALDDKTPPNRYRFAKVCGFGSYKEMRRDIKAVYGEEGDNYLDEVDNEINIWMLDWLARSKTKDDITKRKQILEICGLNSKQSVEIVANATPSTARVEMDNNMSERIKSITNRVQDVETIEGKAEPIKDEQGEREVETEESNKDV